MKVAVLGCGTVGGGVCDILLDGGYAAGLELKAALECTEKCVKPYQTDDFEKIVNDPGIEAVAECIGGTGAAYRFVKACLEAGKHVVTPNKALVAEYGIELNRLSREKGVGFLFSAACGGGIPILHNLSIAAATDRILQAGGILNGTCNFMLTRLKQGASYEAALKEAQSLGYAEADPSADVSGLDTMRKVKLLAAAAFGKLPSEGCLCEGIESINSVYYNGSHSRRPDKCIRLVGRTGVSADGSIYAFVQPEEVEPDGEAGVTELNRNIAFYDGVNCGHISLSGEGAGRFPTASAVVRDLYGLLTGTRYMLPGKLEPVKVNNNTDECKFLYRTAAVSSDGSLEESHETVRMTVGEMFEQAEKRRAGGEKVFFAAVSPARENS